MSFWWGIIPITVTWTGQATIDNQEYIGVMNIMAKALANTKSFCNELRLLDKNVNGVKAK